MNIKKLLLVMLIIALLVNIVPLFRFVIRLVPVMVDLDLKQETTAIGTPYGNKISDVFEVIYLGSKRMVNGENIYDLKKMGTNEDGTGFIYPPLMATLIIPLTALNLVPAYLFLLFSLITLVILFIYLGTEHIKRLKLDHNKLISILFIISVILSTPLVRQYQGGHYMPIILALYALIYFYHDRNWIVTGISLGVASNLMLYSLIIFPFLFIRKRFKALILGITVFIASFIPFLFNTKSFFSFIEFVRSVDKFAFMGKPLNDGIAFTINNEGTFFFLHKLLYDISPMVQKLYLLLIFALFIYIAILIWNNIRLCDNRIYRIYYAMIILFVLMIDIWLSEHHLPIILLSLLLLIGEKEWEKFVIFGYVLTNMLIYDFHIQLNNAWLFSYIRQIGIVIIFSYAIYVLIERMKLLKFRFSAVPKLKFGN